MCDKTEDFDIKAQDMIQRFKEQGYKNSVIYKAYNRAKNSRDELLVQRQKWLCPNVGNYRCGNCNHCENMVKTNTFIDVTSGWEFKEFMMMMI